MSQHCEICGQEITENGHACQSNLRPGVEVVIRDHPFLHRIQKLEEGQQDLERQVRELQGTRGVGTASPPIAAPADPPCVIGAFAAASQRVAEYRQRAEAAEGQLAQREALLRHVLQLHEHRSLVLPTAVEERIRSALEQAT